MSNLQEQIAGTDPLDAASALRLDLSLSSSRVASFSWGAVVGRAYQLEYSTNLAAGFVDCPDAAFPRTAGSTNESYDIPWTNSPAQARFFRLRIVR